MSIKSSFSPGWEIPCFPSLWIRAPCLWARLELLSWSHQSRLEMEIWWLFISCCQKSKSPKALGACIQLRLNPAGGWMLNLSKAFVHVFLIWLQAVALDIQHLLRLLWGGVSA